MSGPIHILKHEHRVIERGLRALDGICARLTWAEHVPADALISLVDFISGYADQFHHFKEESYLFPALQRRCLPGHEAVLGLIEREHEHERQLMAEMRHAIEGYKGVDPNSRQRFVDAAQRISDLLVGHIEHEDAMLFRIADEVLDQDEMKVLYEAFKRTADELGKDRLEMYERTAAELEESWGV
jgi:hemerythrin-like domain-containing protein